MPKFPNGIMEFNYRIEEFPHEDVTYRRLAALEEVTDNNLHSLAVSLSLRFPHWFVPHYKNARRFCRLIFYRLAYTEQPIQSSMSHWDKMQHIMMCCAYKNPFPAKDNSNHPWRAYYKRRKN